MEKSKKTKFKKRDLFPYMFIMPYFVTYIAFSLYPMAYSFFLSFTEWNIIKDPVFIGLDNYVRLFKDVFFTQSILNTIAIISFSIPIQLTLGFTFAFIIDRYLFGKWKQRVQVLFFLPYLTTPVAIGVIFQLLFATDGPINELLGRIGIESIIWTGEVWSSRMLVILMKVWKSFGYSMILFLAGLITIPEELYEASDIDGANGFQKVIYITIPLLKNVVVFVITMAIIAGFQLFDEPAMLFTGTGVAFGGPGNKVLTMVMYYYETAFTRFELSYGATMGYAMLVLVIWVTSFVKWLARGDES